eukprot:CAMPEP_0178991686 /NCGR_PEP_ID=MMETSP0795-20121207/5671_1 /TAXON_ID=88552 /ORGANISM="Amoebophrya sp., Strain Ameob2" /LENGTH=376 /DNA_ID=CAMNT_0020683433 /DNA_START=55 /DNA_END=1182 /DNA_ORIENTATION=-
MPTIFPTRSRIAAPTPLHGDLDAVATKRAANLIAAKSLREGKKLGRRRSGSFGAADNSSFGRFSGDNYGSDTDDDGNDMSMSIHMHQPPPPGGFTTTSRNLPPLKTLGRNFYANRRPGGSIKPGGVEQQFTALEQLVVPQPAYRMKNGSSKLQNHPRAPAFAAGEVNHGVAYAANQQLNVGENMLFDMMHERRRAEELVSAAEISKQRLLQPSPTDTEASIGLGGLGRVGFGSAEADFFAAEEELDEAVEPGSSWVLPGADESGSALPLTSSSSSSSSSASSSRNTSKRSRRGQGNKAGKGHFGSMSVPVGLTDPLSEKIVFPEFDEVTRRYQITLRGGSTHVPGDCSGGGSPVGPLVVGLVGCGGAVGGLWCLVF